MIMLRVWPFLIDGIGRVLPLFFVWETQQGFLSRGFGNGPDCVADPCGTVPRRCFSSKKFDRLSKRKKTNREIPEKKSGKCRKIRKSQKGQKGTKKGRTSRDWEPPPPLKPPRLPALEFVFILSFFVLLCSLCFSSFFFAFLEFFLLRSSLRPPEDKGKRLQFAATMGNFTPTTWKFFLCSTRSHTQAE